MDRKRSSAGEVVNDRGQADSPSRGTIFIVDDDPDMRESLSELVASVRFAFKSYASAEAFLDDYDPAVPGCILLDVRMPGLSGIDVQEELRQREVATPVIIITGHGDISMAVRAVKNGAFDFMEKPCRSQVLLDRIAEAIEHDVKQRRLRERRLEIEKRLAQLTLREQEVVDLIVAGRLNKQIACQLGIGERTVEVHRSHAMCKLNVNTAADLACLITTARQTARAGT